jgi:polygalacturonase
MSSAMLPIKRMGLWRRKAVLLYGILCCCPAIQLCCHAPASESPGRVYNIVDFGAAGDSVTVNTKAIQQAIDECFENGGGTVLVPVGCFSSGAIFLKEKVNLEVEKGARLRAVNGLAHFPTLKNTRIAGIEMDWPSAFINVIDAGYVKISGAGTIDGSGYYWWEPYWKKRDSLSATIPADLIDWYVPRPRLILFHNAHHAALENLRLRNSGFWTVHICYSSAVSVDGVDIYNPVLPEGKKAASSDGIDVDSSRDILISNSSIACDDDCIAIKSGRGSDGLRVNMPTSNVVIENCFFGAGHGGVSIGTETAGGIQNVMVRNCKADGNRMPIKFKPRPGRGGVIENIVHSGWEIHNARTVIDYAYREVNGEDYIDEWQKIKVPFGKATPRYRNITIRNLKATGAERSISFMAWPLAHAENIHLQDIAIESGSGANFQYVDNLVLDFVRIAGEDISTGWKEVNNVIRK